MALREFAHAEHTSRISSTAGWPGLRLGEGPEEWACHAGSRQAVALRLGLSGGTQGRLQQCHEFGVSVQAAGFRLNHTLLDDHQMGDAIDSKMLVDVRTLVEVDLDHFQAAAVVFLDLMNGGFHGLARGTPRRGEVDQDRGLTQNNRLVERSEERRVGKEC